MGLADVHALPRALAVKNRLGPWRTTKPEYQFSTASQLAHSPIWARATMLKVGKNNGGRGGDFIYFSGESRSQFAPLQRLTYSMPAAKR